jgi:hypothetical protein
MEPIPHRELSAAWTGFAEIPRINYSAPSGFTTTEVGVGSLNSPISAASGENSPGIAGFFYPQAVSCVNVVTVCA